ncbi:hypothetical protein TNCV_3075231 [Trichonephila clavipes]|nr:hypothetical protein TNCV_3075231 [Trichonephila clavipes]
MGQEDRIQENSKDLGKPRVRRVRTRETRTTTSGTNRAAERRPVRSKQVTAVRPCPYYLRSRVRNSARNTRGAEEQRNRKYPAVQPEEKEPQHGSLRRRSGG